MKSPRIGSAAIVFDGAGRILLGRRAKDPGRGEWVIPGGKIEYGETIAEAARRELKEETGLDITVLGRVGIYEMIDSDQHRVIVYSKARAFKHTNAMGSDDLLEPTWFTSDELHDLELSEFITIVLRDAGVIW